MEVIADTTVLVDIWRCRRSPGRRRDLHRQCGEKSTALPWIAEAEFLRGAVRAGVDGPAAERFLDRFARLDLGRAETGQSARLWSLLCRAGRASGFPDLWVAAAALHRGLPLLTRNDGHFAGIPGLEVLGYRLLEV